MDTDKWEKVLWWLSMGFKTNDEERWESVLNERMRFSQTSLQEKCPFILSWQVWWAAHSTLHFARSKTFSRPTMFRTSVSQVFSSVEIHFSGAFGDLWVLRSRLDFALGKVRHVHGGQSPTISRWSAALFRNWNADNWNFRYENTFSRYFGGFAVCIRKLWSSHVHPAVSGASG